MKQEKTTSKITMNINSENLKYFDIIAKVKGTNRTNLINILVSEYVELNKKLIKNSLDLDD